MRRRQSEMMGLYQNQNQNQDPNNPYAQQGYNPGDPNAPQPQAGQAMQPGQYPGGGQPGQQCRCTNGWISIGRHGLHHGNADRSHDWTSAANSHAHTVYSLRANATKYAKL